MTMCATQECSKFKGCYRAQAIPHEYWQSYFEPLKSDGTCDYFCSILPTDKVVKKEKE